MIESMEQKYYTYVLLTAANTLYCGYTTDVQKRFEAHISGKGAKYTRSHKPVKILYSACFETKSEALKEERRIKHLKRSEKIEFINKHNKN